MHEGSFYKMQGINAKSVEIEGKEYKRKRVLTT